MKTIIKASAFASKLFSYQNCCLSLFFLLLLSSCTSVQTNQDENLHPAFNYTSVQQENLVYHIATIQLNHPEISIGATAPVHSSMYTTLGETTKSFAKKTGAYLAINASPFSYPATRLSSKRTIEGAYIHSGVLASPVNSNYAALCFTKEKKAFIVNEQTVENTQDAYYAFSGFWTILENKTIYDFKDIKDARTAVGISEDGFMLYILTVEKNSRSRGLSFMECAQILKNSGASTALQLDGGNSTNLIFPTLPHQSVYSRRKVANNIAFFVDKKD